MCGCTTTQTVTRLTKREEMKAPTPSDRALASVREEDIGRSDILLGRGGKTNHHPGECGGALVRNVLGGTLITRPWTSDPLTRVVVLALFL